MLKNSSCARWHDAGSSGWLSDTTYGFSRGYYGVFSFSSNGSWTGSTYCGRGVAVVGTGL